MSAAVGSEQSHLRRPEDTPFKQQRLPSWQPILTPQWIIGTFFVIGIIFVSIGAALRAASDAIVEYSLVYDGSDSVNTTCEISATTTTTCQVTFNIDKRMEAPIYVYYGLTNFYQNHRRYVKSRSTSQFQGEVLTSTADLIDCDPLIEAKDSGGVKRILSPCGLIANSLFNDVITIHSSSVSNIDMSEKGIAWNSDKEDKFLQPDGFKSAEKEAGFACTADENLGKPEAGEYNDTDGNTYCYYYPKDDSILYLYELYPEVVSPLDGVKNEHFIVWMRTAGLPSFRKLYGKIENDDLPAGSSVTFSIDANFDVSEYDGTKSLIISTIGTYGGKNPFLGTAYITVGSLSLIFAALFAIKAKFFPREVGSLNYLDSFKID